jgi:glutamine---fructose-6-phosphate transaminase (isomerizing)
MCGIVGFVGSSEASEHVLDGLRRLEYRGYDSAGIATVHNGAIHLRRRKGKLKQLERSLREEALPGELAVGHTRWATHGKPSEENAHPHQVGDVVVVHNGIIENFIEIKHDFEQSGREFSSETDTEVIAHLIANEEGSLEQRVRLALRRVRGAYAIAVVSEREPDTLVVAKNASPLIVGVLEGAAMVASDIPALLPFTRDIVVMEENELAVLRPGELRLSSLDGQVIDRKPQRIAWSPVMAEKGGHRHFMHKEMFEQPRSITDTLRGRLGETDDSIVLNPAIIQALTEADKVVFTACGTSYHACMVGRLLIEDLLGISATVELASELRYRSRLLGPGALVLAVSQSGETADTLAAITEAKRRGSKVLSIVNVLESSIARASDWTLYTHAGPEIGVASTKAFITQVATLALLALGGLEKNEGQTSRLSHLVAQLRSLPLKVQDILAKEKDIQAIGHRLKDVRSALFLGRGYGHPTALEGALKLKEISYIHAEGYAAGEMKHGPIALVEPGLPCIFIATDDALTYEKTVTNLQEVRAREGKIIAIATEGNPHIEQLCDDVIFVPEVDPILVPLVASIPLQLLAYHVADARGTDIDQPRNLAKSVTVE